MCSSLLPEQKIFFSFLLLGPSFMRSYYVYLHKLPLVKTLLGMTAMFAGTTSSHVLEVSEAHFLVLQVLWKSERISFQFYTVSHCVTTSSCGCQCLKEILLLKSFTFSYIIPHKNLSLSLFSFFAIDLEELNWRKVQVKLKFSSCMTPKSSLQIQFC